MAARSRTSTPASQTPQAPKPKKKIKVTREVDGHPIEEEVEVDDVEGPSWPNRSELKVLDKDLRRVDGPDKVTGRARYTHDVRVPGMLFARLLLSPHPHAEVKVDVTAASAIPGVEHARALAQGEVKYLGQPVAAVAARTPELAEDGLRAIQAEFKPLPWAVTYEQALAPDAPKVTDRGNVREDRSKGERTAAEAALAGCDAVVEATYRVPVHHHACLETHGVVVDYRGGEQATIYASTQGTFTILDGAPRALGVQEGEVTAIVEHMGGGFGSKFGLDIPGQHACALARELKRPIHLMLTREDEFLTAGNRSGAVATLKGGANKQGELVALVAEVSRLGGLGTGSHPGLPYIYKFATEEGVFASRRSVHTHTDSSRAMRAPGHPQASFAMESLVDELAYKVGVDPLAFRKANLSDPVYARQLDAVAELIGWAAHPNKTSPANPKDSPKDSIGTGIGFAIATWGGGGRAECKVEVRIEKSGGVSATVGTQDLGTGTRTYVAAIVAEELGLPASAVTARIGNSNYGRANASGGSTTVASLAPAVKDAAFKALRAFLAHLAPRLSSAPELLVARGGEIYDSRDRKKGLSWNEACATLGAQGLSAIGEWQNSLAGSGVHGALAAKVQVDFVTGAVQVVQMAALQDMGLPLNRLAARSQMNGGMIQALSYGLFEERVIDPDLGLMLNANFADYKLAGCEEIPEIVAVIDDLDTRGVIGMSEASIIPGHSAIANAVFNACGVRLRELPLTCDKVLMGLEELARSGGAK
jgi:xanthine dehydrogenase YagR molybdenum-binding subunit